MNKKTSLLTPIEYLQSKPNVGKTLFYPGAGNDKSPLELFINNSSIETIIHVDYLMDRSSIETMLHEIKGWRIEGSPPPRNNLHPEDFNRNSWIEFWPDDQESLEHSNQSSAFAFKALLKNRDTGKTKEFYFFATEAIQTYTILIDNNVVPDIIVLEDYGMMYKKFGGDSLLYQRAFNCHSLPQYLFVGKNAHTLPWPNYSRVTEYEVFPHLQRERAIFSLNK